MAAADTIFNVVYFAVIISVLVQGPTVGLVTRFLGLAQPLEPVQIDPIELVGPAQEGLAVERLTVESASQAEGKRLVDVASETTPLVILIERDGRLLIPAGSSRMLPGDHLFVLGETDSVEQCGRWSRVRRLRGHGLSPADRVPPI